MPSDPIIAERLRQAAWPRGFEERYFFGGVTFFLHGNMAVGVYHRDLIARIGDAAATEALQQPHVHPMDITGRPMRGWVRVEPAGFAQHQQLEDWIDLVFDFVGQLPPKPPRRKTPRKPAKRKSKK